MRTSMLPRGSHPPSPAWLPRIREASRRRPGPQGGSARTACPSGGPGSYSFLQFIDKRGHKLEEIADDAEVGNLEDRGLLVLVDGDDYAAVLHAGEVLDRARDSHGDVEIGRDDLAGLPHLPVVRHETGVHRRSRSAHCRAQLVG